MDTLKAMRIFVAVHEHGGFAAAARSLGLSKSLVSKQIAMLESHLNTRLFNRTTRHHSLTEAGQLYLDHSKSVIDQVAAMDDELNERSVEPRGTLRINAPLSYGQIRIAPLLAKFMKQFPALKIDLVLTDSFIDLIDEGFDIAIRIGGHVPASMIARKIDETQLGLYASTDWLAANPVPKSKEDFAAHRCLVYSTNGQPRQWRFMGERVAPDWSFLCDNGQVLRRVALDHGGLFFVPDFFIKDDLKQGVLKLLDDNSSPEVLPILALYPHRQYLPLKVRVFVDFLVEGLRS